MTRKVITSNIDNCKPILDIMRRIRFFSFNTEVTSGCTDGGKLIISRV